MFPNTCHQWPVAITDISYWYPGLWVAVTRLEKDFWHLSLIKCFMKQGPDYTLTWHNYFASVSIHALLKVSINLHITLLGKFENLCILFIVNRNIFHWKIHTDTLKDLKWDIHRYHTCLGGGGGGSQTKHLGLNQIYVHKRKKKKHTP